MRSGSTQITFRRSRMTERDLATVAALVELAVLPPLDPPEDELLQAAASSATPLTAAATVNNFLVGTCVFPSEPRNHREPQAPGGS